MNEAEQLFAAVFAYTRAFFERPEVKAHYEAEAKRNAAIQARIDRKEREKREAIEAEKQRAKSYDIWALNGGSDECTQFGINDGCKPCCPVFERGQCSIQQENEELFALDSRDDAVLRERGV